MKKTRIALSCLLIASPALGMVCDHNQVIRNQNASLLKAIVANEFGVVDMLLGYDADPNARSEDYPGITALQLAVGRYRHKIADLLLRYGADPNMQTSPLPSPLHIACENFDKRMICLLLKHGADPNTRDEEGQTPAMYVPAQYQAEIGTLITQATSRYNPRRARPEPSSTTVHVDTHIQLCMQNTTRMHAQPPAVSHRPVSNGHVTQRLRQSTPREYATVSRFVVGSDNQLRDAALRRDLPSVRALIESGIDRSSESFQETLSLALEAGDSEIVQILLGQNGQTKCEVCNDPMANAEPVTCIYCKKKVHQSCSDGFSCANCESTHANTVDTPSPAHNEATPQIQAYREEARQRFQQHQQQRQTSTQPHNGVNAVRHEQEPQRRVLHLTPADRETVANHDQNEQADRTRAARLRRDFEGEGRHARSFLRRLLPSNCTRSR